MGNEDYHAQMRAQMEVLRDHAERARVRIDYVVGGSMFSQEAVLQEVTPFLSIKIRTDEGGNLPACGGLEVPLIGYGFAIRGIYGQDGRVLYRNPLVPDDYHYRVGDDELIHILHVESFGAEVIGERIRFSPDDFEGFEERLEKIREEGG